MLRKHKGFIIFFFFAVACHTSPAKKEVARYFPVVAFFQGQIHDVDSLQLPVTEFTTVNNITDSVLLSMAEFKSLAANFISADISDSSLGKHYIENSFADQTIASVTLTYSTADKALSVQRLDVIIHPDPISNDQVRSIYMERSYSVNNTGILEKLYWRANRNFQIVTIKQPGTGAPETSVIKVVWNNND